MQTYTNEKTPGIRTKEGGVKVFPLFLLTVYVVVAAVFSSVTLLGGGIVPSAYFELLISVAMPIIGIAIFSVLTAGIKPLMPYCIITALLLFMGANLSASSAIAVLLILFAASAYLFRNKFWWLAVLACVVACSLTYFLTNSIFVTASSAVFLPASFTLYLSFERKAQRVGAVCAISATLGVTLVVLFLAWLYSKEGNLSVDMLKSFFDALRNGLIVSVSDALIIASEQLSTILSASDALSVATAAVTLTFNLFPAITTIVLFVISYITHSLYISVISPTIEDNEKIIHAISFKMSVTSAVLFLVAYFATFILEHEGLSLYATAAQNIYMMLFPGLSLITFGFLGGLSKRKSASCLTSLIYFAIFGLILFIPGIAASIAGGVISIAAFVGAILVIISAVKTKAKNNDKK